ncbi:MAG: hypothetical protein LBC75_00635 [Fibromonadaceae bacterium]|jgi:hypothetical protein|nr:hypothetical protein [Fibromonadaceae bacterium]
MEEALQMKITKAAKSLAIKDLNFAAQNDKAELHNDLLWDFETFNKALNKALDGDVCNNVLIAKSLEIENYGSDEFNEIAIKFKNAYCENLEKEYPFFKELANKLESIKPLLFIIPIHDLR